jgi:hypothetical protein
MNNKTRVGGLTLDEAKKLCDNGNGTYDGAKLLAIMCGVPKSEIMEIWENEKRKRLGESAQ